MKSQDTLRSFTKIEIKELMDENIEMCNTFLKILHRFDDDNWNKVKELGSIMSDIYTPLLVDPAQEEFLNIPKVEIILHKKLREVVALYLDRYDEEKCAYHDLDVDDVLRDVREWENRLRAFNWAWMARLYSPDKVIL